VGSEPIKKSLQTLPSAPLVVKTVVKTEVKTVVKKRAICYRCGRILLHIHAAVSTRIELLLLRVILRVMACMPITHTRSCVYSYRTAAVAGDIAGDGVYAYYTYTQLCLLVQNCRSYYCLYFLLLLSLLSVFTTV
jgi:hypothetical protein